MGAIPYFSYGVRVGPPDETIAQIGMGLHRFDVLLHLRAVSDENNVVQEPSLPVHSIDVVPEKNPEGHEEDFAKEKVNEDVAAGDPEGGEEVIQDDDGYRALDDGEKDGQDFSTKAGCDGL
jgi:hypothetical protein